MMYLGFILFIVLNCYLCHVLASLKSKLCSNQEIRQTKSFLISVFHGGNVKTEKMFNFGCDTFDEKVALTRITETNHRLVY